MNTRIYPKEDYQDFWMPSIFDFVNEEDKKDATDKKESEEKDKPELSPEDKELIKKVKAISESLNEALFSLPLVIGKLTDIIHSIINWARVKMGKEKKDVTWAKTLYKHYHHIIDWLLKQVAKFIKKIVAAFGSEITDEKAKDIAIALFFIIIASLLGMGIYNLGMEGLKLSAWLAVDLTSVAVKGVEIYAAIIGTIAFFALYSKWKGKITLEKCIKIADKIVVHEKGTKMKPSNLFSKVVTEINSLLHIELSKDQEKLIATT